MHSLKYATYKIATHNTHINISMLYVKNRDQYSKVDFPLSSKSTRKAKNAPSKAKLHLLFP